MTKPLTRCDSFPTADRIAEDGLNELEQTIDTLIVIPNQNLLVSTSPTTTFGDGTWTTHPRLNARLNARVNAESCESCGRVRSPLTMVRV